MDGFDIAEALEARSYIDENSMRRVLIHGDEGDKLYAALGLLYFGLIDSDEARESVTENCGHFETCRAWLIMLDYVAGDNEKLASAFAMTIEYDKIFISTLINICPIFIRTSDLSKFIKILRSLLASLEELKEDLEDVIRRMENRISV